MTRHRRRPVLLILVAIALVAPTGTVSAGTIPQPPPDSSSGNVGTHGFPQDSEASPAGRCRYGFFIGDDYVNHIYRVGVIAPEVYAHPARMIQRIGFRVIAQVWNGTSWVFHAQTSWVHKNATPGTPAPFAARGADVVYTDEAPFRAKVQLRWYAPNGTTIRGRATMFPEWYRAFERDLPPHEQHYDCGGTTG